RLLNHWSNAVVRATGREPKDEVASAFTREEVGDLVSQSLAEGVLDADQGQRINSALEFDVSQVDSVMVPADEVVSVPAGVSAAELERVCARTGFSRFPVRQDDGRFSGYLHIGDVVDIPVERRDEPVPQQRIRALPSVSPDTDLRSALDRMRRIGAHLAEVDDRAAAAVETTPATGIVDAEVGSVSSMGSPVDAPGVTAGAGSSVAGAAGGGEPPAATGPDIAGGTAGKFGLLMLEDLLETLVGEIRDATRRRPERTQRPNGSSGA
ncbi:MAG TPA: CBS domain-containing protein, partial [Nakamurella sp.]|nr:CBS domain-containing protein [Nakamurella sp.]